MNAKPVELAAKLSDGCAPEASTSLRVSRRLTFQRRVAFQIVPQCRTPSSVVRRPLSVLVRKSRAVALL